MKRYLLYLAAFAATKFAVSALVFGASNATYAVTERAGTPPAPVWQPWHGYLIFYLPPLILLAVISLLSLKKLPVGKAVKAPVLAFLTVEAVAHLVILTLVVASLFFLS